MPFEISPNVHVRTDEDGTVRHLRHHQEPFLAEQAALAVTTTPLAIAERYVRDVADIYSIPDAELADLYAEVSDTPTSAGTRVQAAKEKAVMDTVVVSYQQTHFGLPIWEAALSVRAHREPPRITSSTSTLHYDVEVDRPDDEAIEGFAGAQPNAVRAAMKIAARRYPGLRINSTRLLIYRYDPDARYDPAASPPRQDEDDEREPVGLTEDDAPLETGPPTLPLPPVPDEITPGRHYIVQEILFTLALPGWGELNWRAFVEPATRAVLYLRAFVASATGCVFVTDPVTQSGSGGPTSPAATLDGLRASVTLEGLDPPAGGQQPLDGEFVALRETDNPVVTPPTRLSPFIFCDSAPTDDFAAANAYFHNDGVYRMIEQMGFDIPTYFDGTTFPVPVDHRGVVGVNAFAHGNTAGDGMGRFRYGLADAGATVSIASDIRIVLHEFGHTVLWDHVNSPNFGFAHSPGDSFAVILHDPGSQAPDRFLTFPFNPTIVRRHDRDVAAGWGWFGSQYDTQYRGEQVLSTTLFRAYRSTGGDDANVAVQRFAARYMTFLIVKAVGTLTATTSDPDVFATALIEADEDTVGFEGHPGGAFHKVVRWSFEKQGLYQPTGAPTPVTTPGAPPDIDVYIDDGRAGEYAPYLQNFWNTTDIWNRLAGDSGTAHQTPIVGVTNYLYVRVRNRGTLTATGAVVLAYHCKPGTGLVWPDDWKSMDTPAVAVPGSLAPGGTAVVGPFEWTPAIVGHECLLAVVTSPGDLSNAFTVNGSIPHWRLVPFDNNIAQRNVAPVPGGGGGLQLVRAFLNRRFFVANPFERSAQVELDIELPDLLRKRGWGLRFASAGAGKFRLGPRAEREIAVELVEGEPVSAAELRNAAVAGATIRVLQRVDGMPVGGMDYALDPDLDEPARELPDDKHGEGCADAAEKLLDCLAVPADEVKAVRIKRVTVEIDLATDC